MRFLHKAQVNPKYLKLASVVISFVSPADYFVQVETIVASSHYNYEIFPLMIFERNSCSVNLGRIDCWRQILRLLAIRFLAVANIDEY